MEGQLEQIEQKQKLLSTLDAGVAKLRVWVTTVLLVELKVKPEEIKRVEESLNHDSLLFCEPLRELIAKFDDKIVARELDFFRALFPPEYKHIEVPIHLQDKGFAFYEFFKQLFCELDQ